MSIDTNSTPSLLSLKGQVNKHAIVKWAIHPLSSWLACLMFCEDVVWARRKCLPTREDFRESRNNRFLLFPQCCTGAVVPNENINFVLFGTNTCMCQTCKVRTLLCKVKTEIDPAPCSSIEFGELCGLRVCCRRACLVTLRVFFSALCDFSLIQ